jgi:hypothetical protein
MSLSLFASVEIEIFVNDDDYLDYTKKMLPNKGWNHISIILQNNNLVYLLNGEVFKRINDFSPRELVVVHRSPIFFKIHNCKYEYSFLNGYDSIVY